MRLANLIIGIISGLVMFIGIMVPFFFLVGFGFISFFLAAMGADMNDPSLTWVVWLTIFALLISLSAIAVFVLSGLAFSASKKIQVRKYVKFQTADCICILMSLIMEIIFVSKLGILGQDQELHALVMMYYLWPVIQGGLLAAMIALTVLHVKKTEYTETTRVI